MKAVDWIFKLGLLIIGIAFVAVYFLSLQNGRYQFTKAPGFDTVFDTQTGIYHSYYTGGDEIEHIDLANNIMIIAELKGKEKESRSLYKELYKK